MSHEHKEIQESTIINYTQRIINPVEFVLRNIDNIEKVVMLRLLVEMREVNSDYYDFKWEANQVYNLKRAVGKHQWKDFCINGRNRFNVHIKDSKGKQKESVTLFTFGKTDESKTANNNGRFFETRVVNCLKIYKDYFQELLDEDNKDRNNKISGLSMRKKYDIIIADKSSTLFNLLHYDLCGTCTLGILFGSLIDIFKKQGKNELLRKAMCKEIYLFAKNVNVIKDDLIRALLIKELLYPIYIENPIQLIDCIKWINETISEMSRDNYLCKIEQIYCDIIHEMYCGINNNIKLEYAAIENEIKYTLLYELGYITEYETKLSANNPKHKSIDVKSEANTKITGIINEMTLDKDIINFEFYYKELKEKFSSPDIDNKEEALLLAIYEGLNNLL